jgi:response regulator RpfG family c-di-GMP phosphodiesterase
MNNQEQLEEDINLILNNQCENIEEYKELLKKSLKHIQKSDKRLKSILKRSDKDHKKIKNLNTELEEYKKELELKVEDGLKDLKTLNKELENTQRDVIFTMGTIGELRSNETGLHVKRVAIYSYILARKYGLSSKEAHMLKQVSPMHDIGKIAIPDSILNKPGRLTSEEFDIMKTHTQLGYDMLKSSDRELMQMASIVALQHHEKYDGSGYPEGLKGEDIHIYGRITALADVFDALGSDRCYKKAWEDERIFNLFKEEKGKHFDPKLVDIFFENLDDFLTIRDKYQESCSVEKENN